MMLYFAGGEPFSSGWVHYEYRPATRWDSTNRLLVPVKIGGFDTLAMVDTGAPFTVCTPELAKLVGLAPGAALEAATLRWHTKLRGHLYRQDIVFLAEEGRSIQFDMTMFVPDVDDADAWAYGRRPFVIGMGTCLEFIRFAIDPDREIFYFGRDGGQV